MKIKVFLCFIFLSHLTTYAQQTISSRTSLFIDKREPIALQKAAQDLSSDLEKVFGVKFIIVNDLRNISSNAICIAYQYNFPLGISRPTGTETLLVQSSNNLWPQTKGKQTVLLSGSDLRGTIYAIYHFSQEMLGVDPMYWWSDHAPAKRTKISVPKNYRVQQGNPSFKYRGWFINDEDLLTGWKVGPTEKVGISLKVWDKIFELLLRLKGNIIVPGSFTFADEPQLKAASDRGLVITHHHVETLGLNVKKWPGNEPYSFISHPDKLIGAWTNAVKQQSNLNEVIWAVGYRGKDDYAFWKGDSLAPTTDKGRADVIRAAIDTEIGIVKKNRKQPTFIMNSWAESASLIADGHLEPPKEAILVWPDNGYGILQDKGQMKAGQGIYYHNAMHDFRACHLSEMVPFPRIKTELGRAFKSGATQYLLLNTSNIRPVLMSTRAIMELSWDAPKWLAAEDKPNNTYLDRWLRYQYGLKAVPYLQDYYKAYYKAFIDYGNPDSVRKMGDVMYYTFGRAILGSPPVVNRDPTKLYGLTIPEIINYCEAGTAGWQKTLDLAHKAERYIPANRLHFFNAQVITPARLHFYSSQMLLSIARAELETNVEQKLKHLTIAYNHTQKVLTAFQKDEHGKWAGFYNNDWCLDVRYTARLIEANKHKLMHGSFPSDFKLRIPWGVFDRITAYQEDRQVQILPIGSIKIKK